MSGRTMDSQDLITVIIEGVEMKVSPEYAKYGQVKKGNTYLRPDSNSFKNKNFFPSTLPGEEFTIVSNYSNLIRSYREKKQLSQEEFSRLLNERESLIAKFEAGSLKPRIEVARKIGKLLNLNLVVKDDLVMVDKTENSNKNQNDSFTLGDFIKVRKR